MTFDNIHMGLQSRVDKEVVSSCEALVDLVIDRELTPDEAAAFARSIAKSGTALSLPTNLSPFADIPSTGAPGSLSTILCPYLLAASGLRVPKISASGSVAGGIDTLAVFPGFRAELDDATALKLIDTPGIFHTLQSPSLCPADRVLIAVRRRRAMMANPSLAAVSLLAKKLAVPGTHVLFDFRVGIEGNIGADFRAARSAATFMLEVAKKLDLSVAIVLTDNRTSPSSSIGRLESLRLLWDALNNSIRTPMDEAHARVCVLLAGHALALSRGEPFNERHAEEVWGHLVSGAARSSFENHLRAQGVTVSPGEFLSEVLDAQCTITIAAGKDGWWFPPSLTVLKAFAKRTAKSGDPHVGYRCLIEPGTPVKHGIPVAQIRGTSTAVQVTPELMGITVDTHGYIDRQSPESIGTP